MTSIELKGVTENNFIPATLMYCIFRARLSNVDVPKPIRDQLKKYEDTMIEKKEFYTLSRSILKQATFHHIQGFVIDIKKIMLVLSNASQLDELLQDSDDC